MLSQDPDIDTTTLGNLEAAAAALDELSGWFLATSASGDAKPDRNHTRPVAASATDQGRAGFNDILSAALRA